MCCPLAWRRQHMPQAAASAPAGAASVPALAPAAPLPAARPAAAASKWQREPGPPAQLPLPAARPAAAEKRQRELAPHPPQLAAHQPPALPATVAAPAGAALPGRAPVAAAAALSSAPDSARRLAPSFAGLLQATPLHPFDQQVPPVAQAIAPLAALPP